MSLTPFVGTSTTLLWSQATINEIVGSPPANGWWPYNTGDATNLRAYSPSTQPITWSTSVPPSLNNINLVDLFKLSVDGNFKFTVDLIFKITSGQQFVDCGATPQLNFTIFGSGGTGVFAFTNIGPLGPVPSGSGAVSYPFNGQFPEFDYPAISDSLSLVPDLDIKAMPWNTACDNYNASNMTISATMKVALNVTCQTGAELESMFCLNFCSQTANLTSCVSNYVDYCFTSTGPSSSIVGPTGTTGPTGPIPIIPSIPIFSNGGDNACNTFLSGYISSGATSDSNRGIDDKLSNVCSIFTGLNDFNTAPHDIQNICACHLPSDFYQNIETSLNQAVPGISGVLDIPTVCWFPPCVNSVYKTTEVGFGKTCPVIQCLDIVAITNNGTIDQSPFNISQINNCISNSGSTSKTIYLIWGGAFIIIIIVVIVLIFIITRKK